MGARNSRPRHPVSRDSGTRDRHGEWLMCSALRSSVVGLLSMACLTPGMVSAQSADTWRTDFTRHTVPLEEIVPGDPPKGGSARRRARGHGAGTDPARQAFLVRLGGVQARHPDTTIANQGTEDGNHRCPVAAWGSVMFSRIRSGHLIPQAAGAAAVCAHQDRRSTAP